MNDTQEPIEPPVLFNMDLANGSTTARFCYEAADVLGLPVNVEDQEILDAYEAGDAEGGEFAHEIVEDWSNLLQEAGYDVRWDAGDVVVLDLRNLSDEERDRYYEESYR